MARKKTRARKTGWHWRRLERLEAEGFRNDEAEFVAEKSIATKNKMKVRRRRKKLLKEYLERYVTFKEATRRMWEDLHAANQLLNNWEEYRRQVYPVISVFPGKRTSLYGSI